MEAPPRVETSKSCGFATSIIVRRVFLSHVDKARGESSRTKG